MRKTKPATLETTRNRLQAIRDRLDNRAEDPQAKAATVYVDRDGSTPQVGISAADSVVVELEQAGREIEPLLVELGEKIDANGKTPDGRVLEWAFRELHPGAYPDGLLELKAPFRQLALALSLVIDRKAAAAEPRDARGEWIYNEACKGTSLGTIARRLKKKPATWARIDTPQGIRRAAQRFAKKHNLPLPPPRQSGRPKGRKN